MPRLIRPPVLFLALAACTAFYADVPTASLVGAALLNYDAKLPLKAEVKDLGVNGKGAHTYHITYLSSHNEKVPGLFMLPPNAAGKLPCIILQHGLGGSKDSMKGLAEAMLDAGYACFAIDAKYHGERKGQLPILALLDYPCEVRDSFAQTVVDLRRAVDYLQTREDIDGSRIGYAGVSMGAMLGAMAAGVDTRIQCPVLIVGGANWDLILKDTTLTLATNGKLKNADSRREVTDILAPMDPVLYVGLISPRPVLMINGEKDTVVSPAANKALQAAAKEPKKVVWYPGSHSAPPDLVKKEMKEWFDRYLRPAKN